MKIERIEAFAIEVPLAARYWGSQAWGRAEDAEDGGPDDRWQGFPPRGRRQPAYARGLCTVVVKITCDDGLVGWGEAKAPVAPRVAKGVIDDLLAELLIGQDPRDVVRLWEQMYSSMRLRDHTQGFLLEAMSGIDIACWDILGRSLGVPVYRLLGGAFRRTVPVYASAVAGVPAHATDEQWQNVADQARGFLDRGFQAMKIALGHGMAGDVRTVATVREAVGPDVELYVDAAERYSVPEAAELAEKLRPLGVGFLEAPLAAEDLDGYAELAAKTPLRLASDLLFNRFEVRNFLLRRALGLVQPDVCRSGGITECHRIAQLADAFGVAFQPHVSLGSVIQFAASLQLSAAVPNLFRMEFWAGNNPLGDAVLKRPVLQIDNGAVDVPQGPGLGIEIDEPQLLAHALT